MPENCESSTSASLKGIAKIIEAGAKTGIDVLKSLSGASPAALSGVVDWISAHAGAVECCEEIPPPCWMPRPLCDVVSYGKTGNETTITFVITNYSMATRTISILTTTPSAALTFSATELMLGPMARGSLEAKYTFPSGLPASGTEVLLWIKGCRLHFLRWIIKPGPISADTSYEVSVRDEAEYLHHWYDHFYCPHPCLPDERVPGR
jgi:hypothetical protein